MLTNGTWKAQKHNKNARNTYLGDSKVQKFPESSTSSPNQLLCFPEFYDAR